MEEAIDALGISLLTQPTDVSYCYARMQAAVEDEEIIDHLDALDTRYYELGEDIADLLFQYVKQNLGEFA